MYVNTKAIALCIAAAIYPLDLDTGPGPSSEQRSDWIYEAVGKLLFTDEKKAELYARLEERLGRKTTFNEAVKVIEYAIWETMKP